VTCDVILARLREEFPDWAIGRPAVLAGPTGEHGVWMATRKGLLHTDEMDGGLCHTLTAGTADELRSALDRQRIASRRPRELT
jgi:hypothetical protein